MNSQQFNFRLDSATAQTLNLIADKWKRSQADTLRLLIRAASKLAQPESDGLPGEIRGPGSAIAQKSN